MAKRRQIDSRTTSSSGIRLVNPKTGKPLNVFATREQLETQKRFPATPTSGGGAGGSRNRPPTASGISEFERQRRIAEQQRLARIKALELQARTNEQARVELRRLQLQQKSLARKRSILDIKKEARRRGIDISTGARQISFINKLRREAEKGKLISPTKRPTRVRGRTILVSPTTKSKDPFAVFLKEDIPFIFKDFKSNFLQTPENEKAVDSFINKIQARGDKEIERLDGIRQNIREFVDPNEKEIREQAQRNLVFFSNQQNQLNTDVENFNNNFGNQELSVSEFNQAQKQSELLAKKQATLNLKIKAFDDASEDLRKRRGKDPFEGVVEAFKGIITSPVTLGSSAVSFGTRPVSTVKGVGTGLKALPSEISQAPFTTLGGIVGELIGTGIITGIAFSLLRSITSTKVLTTSKKNFIIVKKGKVKGKVSRSFPQEFKLRINDVEVQNFVINQFKKNKANFNKLSKIEQNFIVGQIKAKIRNNPELFIPKTRKTALRRFKKKDLRRLLRERLEGKFDSPVVFRLLKKKGQTKRVVGLSKTQKLALKRLSKNLEKKRIKEVITERLKPKELLTTKQGAELIRRIKRRVKLDPTLTLTKTQKLSLKKIKTKAEGERIRSAILKGAKPKKFKDLLSSKQKTALIKKIKRRVKLDPELTLTKTQRRALRKIETKEEFVRIRKAVDKGLKPKKLEDLLSSRQKLFLIKRLKRRIKLDPRLILNKTQRKALNRVKTRSEFIRVRRAIEKGFKTKKIGDVISEAQKQQIIRNVKRRVRSEPEKFIPSGRQQALVQVQRQVQKAKLKDVKKPLQIKIVSGELTSIQKLTLKRFNKVRQKKSKIDSRVKKVDQKVITINQILQEAQREIQKIKQRQRLLLKQKPKRPVLKQRQLQRQKLKSRQKVLVRTKSRQNLLTKTRFGLLFKQRQLFAQGSKLKQSLLQKFRQKQTFKQVPKQAIAQVVAQDIKQVQKQRLTQLKKLRLRTRRVRKVRKIRGFRIRKKVIRRKKRQQGFNVFGRPLKRKGAKKKPKLIKINRVPLTKNRAKDLRNYITDTSLSRTSSIRATRLRARKPRIKAPLGYAKRTKPKFRTFRIRKGKRIKLKNNRVIERGGKGKSNRLLDTIQERRGITLKKRLSQLNKQAKRKNRPKNFRNFKRTKRSRSRTGFTGSKRRLNFSNAISSKANPVRRKRTLSQAQLRGLAKGRRIRLQNIKRRRK